MASPAKTPGHIEVTETMVRLYVLLAQYLDRCLDGAQRRSYPDSDLQAHLSETRRKAQDIATVNPIVRGKVEQECDRILALWEACRKDEPGRIGADRVKAERAILQNKLIALSDLLALFRALAAGGRGHG